MTDSERQRSINRLRFPPALERAFQEEYYQHARTTMRIGCMVFTLLMVWWGMAEYLQGAPASRRSGASPSDSASACTPGR